MAIGDEDTLVAAINQDKSEAHARAARYAGHI